MSKQMGWGTPSPPDCRKQHQGPGKPFPKWLQRVPLMVSTHVLYVCSSTECSLNNVIGFPNGFGWFWRSFLTLGILWSPEDKQLPETQLNQVDQTKWDLKEVQSPDLPSELMKMFFYIFIMGGRMVENFLGLILLPCLFSLSSLD